MQCLSESGPRKVGWDGTGPEDRDGDSEEGEDEEGLDDVSEDELDRGRERILVQPYRPLWARSNLMANKGGVCCIMYTLTFIL